MNYVNGFTKYLCNYADNSGYDACPVAALAAGQAALQLFLAAFAACTVLEASKAFKQAPWQLFEALQAVWQLWNAALSAATAVSKVLRQPSWQLFLVS